MAVKHMAEKNDEGISLSALVVMELIEAVQEKGASFRFQARGYSMTPAIRNGDVITVSPLKNLLPRRGDVLAFRHPDRTQMLVHRVLHARVGKYLIQGDNCPIADGWIPAENILGLITRVEHLRKDAFLAEQYGAFFWIEFLFVFYPFWFPVRRILAKIWRRLRVLIRPGN